MTLSFSQPNDGLTIGNPEAVSFSAVITLYNEEGNVEPLTRNLISAFRDKFAREPFELVLVLNGPLDTTPAIAGRLANEYKEITLVRLNANRGYGGGILAGLSVARGDVVGFLCGDEQIESSDVVKVFAEATTSPYDLVKVRRVVRQDGWQRVLVTSVYNQLCALVLGLESRDVNGTPKVFKKDALSRLSLTATDWFLDAEVMIQVHKQGLTVKEIPVVFKMRREGKSNVRFWTVVEFLKNMWKYRHGKN